MLVLHFLDLHLDENFLAYSLGNILNGPKKSRKKLEKLPSYGQKTT